MVTFTGVCRHYGTRDVLLNVSCSMGDGEKLGLIGDNGAGKTTLVRLLTGEEEASSGRIAVSPGTRIGYVPQHLAADPDMTAMELMTAECRALKTALEAEELGLSEAPAERIEAALAAYQRARDAFDRAGGDGVEDRAEKLLDGLGLGDKGGNAVGSLSGGERNALSLAKALMGRPTLLVLDEPGNHLDYAGLSWLESFLQKFNGAVLIVSHIRYMLDRVVGGILELENMTLTRYAGNYSQYRLERLRKAVARQAEYSANQKRLAELEELVRRFADIARRTSDPGWGRRLKARKTQLSKAREDAVERPEIRTARIGIRADVEETRADIALQVNAYSRAFDGRELFRNADLLIPCGERAALVGPNGCGKTTFLRDVVERARWDSRTLRIGPSLRVGYCAQHQEVFRPEKTVLEELVSLGVPTRTQAFSLLSRFLFAWADLDKRVADLSGGEKNRLQLARVVFLKSNFLILDEPTNHMDIRSREAIEESLSSFPGTILVVSHDRYLLDKVATMVIEVEDLGFTVTRGSFSEVWAGREPFLTRSDGRTGTRRRRYENTSGPKAGEGGRGQEIERRITEMEAAKRSLEAEMTAAFTEGDRRRGRALGEKLDRTSRILDELYREWEKECG